MNNLNYIVFFVVVILFIILTLKFKDNKKDNFVDYIKAANFSNNLLDYQQYTKPSSIMGYDVPEILLSGDHNKTSIIRRWITQ